MATAAIAPGLIDTDILIDASRGHVEGILFLNPRRQAKQLLVSVVSVMELIGGCGDSHDLRRVQRYLKPATILPLTANASLAAYRLMESFYLSHSLQIPDAMIAATALERGLTLYTRNVRHFRMIPDLKLVAPY